MNDILSKLKDRNSHGLCYKLLTVFGLYDKFKNDVKFSEIKLILSSNNIQNKILALEKLSEIKVSTHNNSFYIVILNII